MIRNRGKRRLVVEARRGQVPFLPSPLFPFEGASPPAHQTQKKDTKEKEMAAETIDIGSDV
jgi:hypothetical protein